MNRLFRVHTDTVSPLWARALKCPKLPILPFFRAEKNMVCFVKGYFLRCSRDRDVIPGYKRPLGIYQDLKENHHCERKATNGLSL